MRTPDIITWPARQIRTGLVLGVVMLGLSTTLLAPAAAEAGPLNPKPGPSYAPDLAVRLHLATPPTPLARTWVTTYVRNQGSTDAAGVRVNTTLPDGFTDIKFDNPPGECGVSGNTVTCAIRQLPAGTEAPINIGANAPPLTGAYTVTVVVDPENLVKEGKETNNAASATINVY